MSSCLLNSSSDQLVQVLHMLQSKTSIFLDPAEKRTQICAHLWCVNSQVRPEEVDWGCLWNQDP